MHFLIVLLLIVLPYLYIIWIHIRPEPEPIPAEKPEPPPKPFKLDKRVRPGAFYIMLSVTAGGDAPDYYHWALYHHRAGWKGGKKWNIRQVKEKWTFQHIDLINVTQDPWLVGLLRISDEIDESKWEKMGELIVQEDGEVNKDKKMRCRVWALNAIARLVEEGMIRLITNLDDLELDAKAFGNKWNLSAMLYETPRPVSNSTVCVLDEPSPAGPLKW